jgi:hypothetical protein
MALVFQLIFWGAGLPLTLLVIAAMLRGAYRQYPVLFLYTIAGFLLTVAGMPAYIAFYFYHEPGARLRMGRWNWWNDLLLEPLAYAVVISLIYVAASHVRSRRTVLLATIAGATLIAGFSFFIHFSPALTNGEWMALWTRDLNFFSEILDLGLWGLLLSTKSRDPRLLLVTGGLGIQFTGEAIGDSLRSIAAERHSFTISYTGGFVTTVADLVSLYIFWKAFQRTQNRPRPANGAGAAASGRAPKE